MLPESLSGQGSTAHSPAIMSVRSRSKAPLHSAGPHGRLRQQQCPTVPTGLGAAPVCQQGTSITQDYADPVVQIEAYSFLPCSHKPKISSCFCKTQYSYKTSFLKRWGFFWWWWWLFLRAVASCPCSPHYLLQKKSADRNLLLRSGEQKWKQREMSLGGRMMSPPTSLKDYCAFRYRWQQQQQFLCFTQWNRLPSPSSRVPAIPCTVPVSHGLLRLLSITWTPSS